MLDRPTDDSGLEATLEKELVRARLEVELFDRHKPVTLGRFEVLRCIGRGSLGVVYEARDLDHGGPVALKLLSKVDAHTIAQFKHEFRVLSGIAHANLVALHELVCERDHWFVSMELIEGVAFDRWLWPDPGEPLDEARLRSTLAQLVGAVSTIHRAGKLHRDLKPSNVLVTGSGRVVVLDFGLVAAQGGVASLAPAPLIGTPGYMSPEQAARDPASQASDWYAVGVMLFEALTHRLPFDGETRTVLREKLSRSAPRVRDLAPDAPPELDRLCQGLLERDPALRAGAAEIENWLGRAKLPVRLAAPQDATPAGAMLVGRERELQLLAASLAATRAGTPATVWLRSAPGMGKSALLDAFAAQVAPDARVLRGQCREEESIPFNLFDAVADALRDALDPVADAALVQLPGAEAAALVQAFPGLGQYPALARAAEGCEPADGEHAAFVALKRVLAALAAERPLAIAIDDLHWSDPDSASMFSRVFAAVDAPACLFIGAFRGDEARSSGFVAAAAGPSAGRLEPEWIDLGPLSPGAAAELAHRLLRAQDIPAPPELCTKLARDTGGIPFLLTELARQIKRPRRSTATGRSSTGAIALGAAIRARFEALPERTRRLLSVLCVASEPLALRLALAAARLPPDEHVAVAHLSSTHLARSRGGRPIVTLEPYHERVRLAVRRALSPAELATIEAELADARALALSGDSEERSLLTAHAHARDRAEQAARALLQERSLPRTRHLRERVLALLDAGSARRAELLAIE